VKSVIFIVAAAITSVFFINFCAAIFRCGCVSLWNGADAHCNVHLAESRHCPWCQYGRIASAVPWALIVGVQAGISFRPRSLHPGARLIAALTAFPLTGGLLAVVYGVSVGYWK